MAVSSFAPRVVRVRASLRSMGRADLAVLGFCALGAGNVWARFGTGNVAVAPNVSQYVVGIVLILVAAALCWLSASRPATLPGAVVCSVAIALQTCFEPSFMLPTADMFLVGLALATVPMIRSGRVGWLVVGAATAVEVTAVLNNWVWGWVNNDVFTEVQGASAALLHGHNPYSPVFSVFLGNHGATQVFGSAAFCYGPMVVLLSLPARVLGDVRLTAVALNLAILAAAIVWARRAGLDARVVRTVTALWVASPFIPFMMLMEWTDSFCVAGLAWWMVLREKHRGWATVALTIGLSSKPSVLLLMVPLLFWSGQARREVAWAAVATLAIIAPFALWTGIPQFVYDTIGVFADLPVRTDGITLDGLAHILGAAFVPGAALSLGIVGAAVVFTVRRQRDYGGLLAAGSGLLIVVCFLGKQAFLNYYYIAAMGLLFVVASGRLTPSGALTSPVRGLRALMRRTRAASAPHRGLAPGS